MVIVGLWIDVEKLLVVIWCEGVVCGVIGVDWLFQDSEGNCFILV